MKTYPKNAKQERGLSVDQQGNQVTQFTDNGRIYTLTNTRI